MARYIAETIRKNHALWEKLSEEFDQTVFYELGYNKIGIPTNNVSSRLVKDEKGVLRPAKGTKFTAADVKQGSGQVYKLIMTTVLDVGRMVRIKLETLDGRTSECGYTEISDNELFREFAK